MIGNANLSRRATQPRAAPAGERGAADGSRSKDRMRSVSNVAPALGFCPACVAAEQKFGPEHVLPLYTAIGTRFHNAKAERGRATIEAALAWAQQAPKSPQGRVSTIGARRMTAARGFARYLSGIDPRTQVPPLGLMPHRTRWRQPFIYTTADIDTLMEAARNTIASPLRAATYQTLIGLLASSGLRIGEAIKLDRTDIDWTQGVLLIRESKFGKSRLVPLHPTSMQALDCYARLRDELQPHPAEPAFFISLKRKRLLYAVVQETFRQLIDTAGIGAGAPSPPRLHDLRHSFAVRTLLAWYRAPENVQSKIPSLSTYLGHREPSSTYWYYSDSRVIPKPGSFARVMGL